MIPCFTKHTTAENFKKESEQGNEFIERRDYFKFFNTNEPEHFDKTHRRLYKVTACLLLLLP